VDLARGEKRFVLNDAANLVFSRDVGGRENASDTVDLGGRGGVEPYDAAMRYR
jgi:hypothetical protein